MLDFWKNKRILVTGHSGFKGAWLSELLLLAGAELTGYALQPPTEPSLFSLLKLPERMRSVEGDIRDLQHMQQVFREVQPEFVLHMAAQPIVRTSYEQPVYTYETNVMGTVNICECVRQSDSVRSFLNVTTDKVYENSELGKGFVETDFLDGYDPYSNSKSCSELVTHSYAKSFLNAREVAVSTARAGNVIGGGDFARDRIIPDCVRAAELGEAVVLRNPDSIRPFQHVLEPLSVYLMILERQYQNPALAGAYNVGPDLEDCVRTGELTRLFAAHWGEGFCWEVRPDGGPHEAGFLKLDCGKLKRTFGWEARWHIDRAIQETVRWSKAWLLAADIREVTDQQIVSFFLG
ncbi:CDP-glucose 4,6-dehydratase [Fusobacterium naviforme]|nr:CDP-glucose 4,6-dehydratase [Fusobacterium naviforme]STO26475.1 CDP-glucose 4,6-dehydratase [Fusobacterium naviforme]